MKQFIWKPVLIIGVLAGLGAIWAAKGLNPGIDLAGGTTLVYDVKVPQGAKASQVIDDTIAILKQRVDPTGTKNLVWRPQAGNRIEVQMPLPPAEVKKRREAYIEARNKLEQANLNKQEVTAALEMSAKTRQARFKQLAEGDDELLSELKTTAKAKTALEQARKAFHQAQQAYQHAQAKADEQPSDEASDKSDDAEKSGAPANEADQSADETGESSQASESPKSSQTPEANGESSTGDNAQATDAKQRSETLLDAQIEAGRAYNAAEDKYERALADVLTSNVSLEDWERIRKLKHNPSEMAKDEQGNRKPTPREKALTQLKQEHPSRARQIDKIADLYAAYEQVKGPLDDPKDLIKLLQGSGILELRMAASPNTKIGPPDVNAYRQRLREKGPRAGGDQPWQWYEIANIQRWIGDDTERLKQFRENPQAFAQYLAEPGAYSQQGLIGQAYGGRFYLMLADTPDLAMTRDQEWSLTSVTRSQDELMRPAVSFEVDPRGQGMLAGLTRPNRGEHMAVLLDNQVITAPRLNSALDQGGGIITGDFSNEEYLHLIRSMKAGSLEGQLGEYPISIRTTGPQLGEENLTSGIQASIIALVIVALFMAGYYFFAGMVANFALAANMIIILGIMSLVEATFTLPGIAGLVLTIGMAVDANVLIFERIREEMDDGADLPTSVRLGFEKALSTVLDANITTLITCLVLGYTATAEVKGFAVVLGIGILSTLFTALFCSRLIFDLYVRFAPVRTMHMLPTVSQSVRRLLSPKIDWLGLRPVFFTLSIVLVLTGLCMVWVRGADMFDIEFRSGTKVSFDLKDKDAQANPGQSPRPASPGPDGQSTKPSNNAQNATKTQSASADNPPSESADIHAATKPQPMMLPRKEVVDRIGEYARVGMALMDDGNPPADADPQIVSEMRRIVDNAREHYRQEMNDWKQAAKGDAKLEQKPQGPADFSDLLNPSVVTQGQTNNGKASGFAVSTLMTHSQSVSAVIKAAFKGELDTSRPINFTGMNSDDLGQAPLRRISAPQLGQVLNQDLPGDDETYDVSQYLGGVAIALREMEPAPTLDDLRQRISRMRQQPAFAELGYRETKVIGLNVASTDDQGRQHYSDAAVVVHDNQTNYNQNPGAFENSDGLAATEWNLVHDALRRDTSLASVTKFSSQISGTMQQRAIAALLLALLAVVAYIWLRFGSVRYGLAAIVALVHDVSITLGVVATCGWLYDTGFGHDLLLTNFKIDLALIAAMLTIIGYSLNDTIVVFDRIRENRGRLAHLSPQIINDSVNQTISRTLLTSTTTLLAIFVLYLFGGPGVHGFAFAMLIGVFVGTYSSIAIACPMLFIGGGGKPRSQASQQTTAGARTAGSQKPAPATSSAP